MAAPPTKAWQLERPEYQDRTGAMANLQRPQAPAPQADITMRGTSGLLAHSNSNNVNNNHNFNNNNNSNNSGYVFGDINPHAAAPYNDKAPKAAPPMPHMPPLPGQGGAPPPREGQPQAENPRGGGRR